MPAVASKLGSLIQSKVDRNIRAVAGGRGPLRQRNPKYYKQMCSAIARGIVQGAPIILLATRDRGQGGTPPIPGFGTGVGIKVDAKWFAEELYRQLRSKTIATFRRTAHAPFPPPKGNSGEYLYAMCKGIADSVAEHYSTAWILSSSHPMVYAGTGTISAGGFSGVPAAKVSSIMRKAFPLGRGRYWPQMCQVIGKVYAEAIHRHSTGRVSIVGVCVPGPSQVCFIGRSGQGSGAAT